MAGGDHGYPRIPGEGDHRRFWRAGAEGRHRLQPRTGRLSRPRDRRSALGRQGADPFRRPRRGRRGQDLPIPRKRSSTPPRPCSASRWSPARRARAAASSAGSMSRRRPRSPARSISASCSTAAPSASWSSPRARAAWRSRSSRSKNPKSILRLSVDPALGMREFQARELAFALGLEASQVPEAARILTGAYRAFRELDATMVEINPLVVTRDGRLIALDTKMSFDDNALFRRPHISELRDKSQEDAREIARQRPRPRLCRPRRQHRLHGQRRRPRHGDAGHDQAERRRARQLPRHRRRREPRARAEGVCRGADGPQGRGGARQHLRRHQPLRLGGRGRRPGLPHPRPEVPVVVRLAGTNVEEGRTILARSGLPIIVADTLATRRARPSPPCRKEPEP